MPTFNKFTFDLNLKLPATIGFVKLRPPIDFAILSFKSFADLTAATKSFYDYVIV